MGKIHPNDIREIAKIQINCPDCDTTYLYNQAYAHVKECKRPMITCVLNCGSDKIFRSVEQLELHISEECQKAVFTCDTCDGTEPRTTKENHRCSQTKLIEAISSISQDSKEVSKQRSDNRLICVGNQVYNIGDK
jgi:hypothetical protein